MFAEAPPKDATLLIYMPGRDFTALAEELLRHGFSAETPCCCVSHAARPEQTAQATTLGRLGKLVPGAAPALLMIGEAVKDAALAQGELKAEWAEPIQLAVQQGVMRAADDSKQ